MRILLVLLASFVFGCEKWPGKPVSNVVPAEGSRESFAANYALHCAACHGPNGIDGAARPLNDSLYLALTPRANFMEAITHGTGALMPAYAASEGGPWDSAALETFVNSIYSYWGEGKIAGSDAPVYASTAGDPLRGEVAFASWCGACHGNDGAGLGEALPSSDAVDGHSIVDPFYLQLVSQQGLRSAVIFGRPSLGMPSYEGPFPGKGSARLDETTLSDITAWLLKRKATEKNK